MSSIEEALQELRKFSNQTANEHTLCALKDAITSLELKATQAIPPVEDSGVAADNAEIEMLLGKAKREGVKT